MDQQTGSEIVFYGLLIIIIVGVFLGAGRNRRIVVFSDYDDLGLTFLIPASTVLVLLIAPHSKITYSIIFIVEIFLLIKLVINTWRVNQSIWKTGLALITKLPISIIWMMNFIEMLNPSGKTSVQRSKNRGNALLVLALLTPVIGLLIVNKQGRLFNPKSWIKGRRVGNIRDHL